mgnify:CR=1 FL=1
MQGNVIFDGSAVKEKKFVPWEVKEAGIKTGFYVASTFLAHNLFPLGPLYGLANLGFALNYCRVSWGYLNNAVTRIDL